MLKPHAMTAESPPQALRLAAWASVILIAVALPVRASIPIQKFGSNDFEIDLGSVTADYSQTANTLTLAGGFDFGNTLGGAFGSLANPFSLNLLSFPAFGLQMQLGDDSPSPFSSTFSVEFFDTQFNSLNRFNGETTTVSAVSSVVWLSLANPDLNSPDYPYSTIASLSNVGGMQFTWDDKQNGPSSSVIIHELVGAEQKGYFVARSLGGFRFITTRVTDIPPPTELLEDATGGVILPSGASAWEGLSDSNSKTGVTAVDHRALLQKVAELPVTAWRYKHHPERPYLGPMAQDFHETFGLGFDDKHISTMDADGVALAALKGLIEELQERKNRSAAQARRLQELEAELGRLQKLVQNLPPAE